MADHKLQALVWRKVPESDGSERVQTHDNVHQSCPTVTQQQRQTCLQPLDLQDKLWGREESMPRWTAADVTMATNLAIF